MTSDREPNTAAHISDKARALAVRAHRITEVICRAYALQAREAGETDKAEAFERMAAQARRKALLWMTT